MGETKIGGGAGFNLMVFGSGDAGPLWRHHRNGFNYLEFDGIELVEFFE